MDVQSIASGLAAASVTNGINVSLMKSVENLDEIQVAKLFSSIGIGSGVDSYA